MPKPLPGPSKPRGAGSRKRSLFYRVLHWIRVAAVVIVAASVGLVLLYRFVPPPATPLMLLRLGEQAWNRKPLRLEKTWRPLERISPSLAAAALISEDQRFFDHHGFDFDAIDRALKRNRKHRYVLGASTITQQTAKNLFLWPGRTWLRKGCEVYFTVLLELLWPKRRILEVYLNVIETGEGLYGAEAAARRYFHRDAGSLGAEKAALLAAILPNPRKWAPPRSPPRVYRRQRWILRQMPAFIGRPELR